jgi:hypothetical protein
VDLALPDDAIELAATARQLLAPYGEEMRHAEYLYDTTTGTAIYDALGELGVWELDVRHSEVEAFAAALVAAECGRIAAPLPIAALLAARAGGQTGVVHAVERVEPGATVLLDRIEFEPKILAIDPSGVIGTIRAESAGRPTRLMAPAAGWGTVTALEPGDPSIWAFHEAFSAYESLGALEEALHCMSDHLRDRVQFGKPLGAFQALQHRYADALRFVNGLRELSQYTLWRLVAGKGSSVSDALVLRAYHLETLKEVFRHAHQVHGAVGFCYEHPLAVLSMWSQYRRYTPLTEPSTLGMLSRQLDDVAMIFDTNSVAHTATGH